MNDDELRRRVEHHDRELDDVFDELAVMWAEVSVRSEVAEPVDAKLEQVFIVRPGVDWRCTNRDCLAYGMGSYPSDLTCPRCGWRPIDLFEGF